MLTFSCAALNTVLQGLGKSWVTTYRMRRTVISLYCSWKQLVMTRAIWTSTIGHLVCLLIVNIAARYWTLEKSWFDVEWYQYLTALRQPGYFAPRGWRLAKPSESGWDAQHIEKRVGWEAVEDCRAQFVQNAYIHGSKKYQGTLCSSCPSQWADCQRWPTFYLK